MPQPIAVQQAKRLLPMNLATPRETRKSAMDRLGITRPRFQQLIEAGEIDVMVTPPGVMKTIVVASVDAYIARLNQNATVAAV